MSYPNISAITIYVKQLNFCSNQEKNIVSKYQNSVVTNHARGEMIDHAASHVFVRDFDPVISDEPPLVADTTRAPPRLSIFWWLEENYQTAKELAEESIASKDQSGWRCLWTLGNDTSILYSPTNTNAPRFVKVPV